MAGSLLNHISLDKSYYIARRLVRVELIDPKSSDLSLRHRFGSVLIFLDDVFREDSERASSNIAPPFSSGRLSLLLASLPALPALLQLLPGGAVQHRVVGGEGEVVRVLVVASQVQLLLPVDHTASGASTELLHVLLKELGSLEVQSGGGVDLVEHAPCVQEDLPDVVHVPLPFVEALSDMR